MKKPKTILLIVVLVLIVSFIAFSIYSSTYRGMALMKTSLVEVDSVTEYPGVPQTLVLGRDESGDEKAVWFSRNKEIQGTAYIDELISEEDARSIGKDEIMEEAISLELHYYDKTTDVIEKTGPYWAYRGEKGEVIVLIDAYTGNVTLLNMSNPQTLLMYEDMALLKTSLRECVWQYPHRGTVVLIGSSLEISEFNITRGRWFYEVLKL